MGDQITPLENYQSDFIEFMLEAEALTFGDFVTKSGRKTPYFINTGKFNTGKHIARLGSFYAQHIVSCSLSEVSSIFGPAYKGVPLCVSAASALYAEHSLEIGYTFNRKEEKDHGDKGAFVGRALQSGDSVVIVEDVITAGTTIREMTPLLRDQCGIEIEGVVISVDRCERGTGSCSAVDEVSQDLNIPVFPIVTIYQILSYLESLPKDRQLTPELREAAAAYLLQYGAKKE